MTGVWRTAQIVAAAMLLAISAQGKPNVVVVFAERDAEGEPDPHLRAFREHAVRLERFMVSPRAEGTRAAVLTGRHEFAAGVSHSLAGRNLLRPDVPVLAEVLRSAGYETGFFGTWGLGDHLPCRPEDRGFQEALVPGGGGIGSAGGHWLATESAPLLRHQGAWKSFHGTTAEVVWKEAAAWVERQVGEDRRVFLAIAAGAIRADGWDAGFGHLLSVLEENGGAERTVMVVVGARHAGTVREADLRGTCWLRWGGTLEPREVPDLAAAADLFPTLIRWCGGDLPPGWAGEGVDLSAALEAGEPLPGGRVVISHGGGWPTGETASLNRYRNYSVADDRYRLTGLSLFDLREDPGETRDVFGERSEAVARLTLAYGAWWDRVEPALQRPVRYRVGDPAQPVVRLDASAWWEPREIQEAAGAEAVAERSRILKFLKARADPTSLAALGSVSGRWLLDAARDGHYRVRLRLLPEEVPPEEIARLGTLRAGKAHVRANREEVVLEVLEGATEISVGMDLEAGPFDLEAWFEGQLSARRLLGAFFVTIERVGDRKRTLRPEVHPAEP